jgi:beta-glucanase (GH16 family)
MFGHVEFVVKAAPGAGIVSSAVLQSDCLDEIDWEWLGGDNNQVQSNYFGKGITTTYNRGAYHDAPGNHDGFKTYTIDWTSEQIVWQIDGVTVRAMTQANAAEGQYPQTPMMIKVGAWSGGDSANAPGTIAWAGGATDYSAGPYTMYLKSIEVQDYSTGTQYTYSGSAGTWQSIQSTGGTINPQGGSDTPTDTSNAPAVTAAAESAPIPFEGTHRDDSSTYVTPSVWPWVGSATATLQTSVSTASVTTYPGLPSGWVVMDDGRVLPPSNAAPMSSSSLLSIHFSAVCFANHFHTASHYSSIS